jgi:hypothetical protein
MAELLLIQDSQNYMPNSGKKLELISMFPMLPSGYLVHKIEKIIIK